MSKIFGISSLPVSTIATSLEQVRVPKPVQTYATDSLKVQTEAVNKKSLVAAKQYTKAARQYFQRIVK